jgi:hypothetical protein
VKIKSVRVQNYKSIEDSGTFSIDQITCMVGKNEAGKTALLQALSKINHVNEDEGDFDSDTEFPNHLRDQYDGKVDFPDVVVTTEWEIDDLEYGKIRKRLGDKVLINRVIKITKGYSNSLDWKIELDQASLVKRLVAQAKLPGESSEPFLNLTRVAEIFTLELDEPTDEQTVFINQVKKDFPEGGAFAACTAILRESLPQFIYFGHYDGMSGQVSLDQLEKDRKNLQMEPSDRIFISLLNAAGTSVEEIIGKKTLESLTSKLEGIQNRITKKIFKYWRQNSDLRVKFSLDSAREGDRPPFNTGYVFRTRIEDTRTFWSVPFDSRSAGFQWFFSFLVWFGELSKVTNDNLIILLDEPGLSLHGKAQEDLLGYVYDDLAKKHQVIYTTHSPFMINPDNLLGVRLVEYRKPTATIHSKPSKKLKNSGTIVREDVLKVDPDTLFPLQAALGYEIAQTLFVGKHTLLVEGPSEINYIYWASSILRQRGREALDKRWVICPSGGISKMASFVSLFRGNKLNIAALTDSASGSNSELSRLREILEISRVFTVATYTETKEADIEDMLGRDFYFDLVNRAYQLESSKILDYSKEPAKERVIKEVEDHMRLLINVDEFDHYRPSKYLMAESGTLNRLLPKVDGAIGRFETLFTALNKLLPQK